MVHVYNCHPFSSQQIVQVKIQIMYFFFFFFNNPVLYLDQVLTNLPSLSVAQVEQEPGLVCCGGGALFVVATGGCKVNLNIFLNHSYAIFESSFCENNTFIHLHW